MTDRRRVLIFVPTYDEVENVEGLCKRLLALNLPADILFIDDNSADGTAELLDRLATEHHMVHVVHRPGKLGIGSAHLAGIRWAYDHGYDRIVTMDCDFTHPPECVPVILDKAKEGFPIVVGSRYMTHDSLPGWTLYRKFLTRVGHWLTRWVLGMPYDATGGFRCYDLTQIPKYAFEVVTSRGYSFFFESLYIFFRNGYRIGEIPIALPNRTYGHSKMDFREVRNSVRLLFRTYFKTLFNPEKFEISEPLSEGQLLSKAQDPQGWESYWENHKEEAGGLLYDAIATFYRKFIIRRSLNWFMTRYFPPNSSVLHAGCGSGQVDLDVRWLFSITGLDISVNALNFYLKTNKNQCQALHGSIFEIPLPDSSVDGVYNLGVMEHFTQEEISRILLEFRRVLKPGGRVIVFWPPEFGLSVIFFKCLKWFFVTILRKKDVKFHPDEISRLRSRKQAVETFDTNGFRLLRYYFGPKDLFTYAVIVAEKPVSSIAASQST